MSMLATLLVVSCVKGGSSKSADSNLMCSTLPESGGSGRQTPEIKRQVRAYLDRFEGCFDQARKRDPKAAGSVETRFVIEPSGSVSSACIHKTTLHDGETLECLLDQFRALHFGPSKGTATV